MSVCFNYGCLTHAEVVFNDEQLRELALLLGEAQDAAQERKAISVAVGRLHGWAGPVSYTHLDVYKRQPLAYRVLRGGCQSQNQRVPFARVFEFHCAGNLIVVRQWAGMGRFAH